MQTVRYILFSLLVSFLPAQDVTSLRREAWQNVDRDQSTLIAMSDGIWNNAETSLSEFKSAAELSGLLESRGFEVERGVANMPTAFVASYGSGRPVIGILAEFDALPGISNKPSTRKEALVTGAPGHGCGHNLFGAASVGAAIAAKQVMESRGIVGTIKLFGCPAEETVIGKVYMAKAGVFDGLDLCLDWHPGHSTGVNFATSRAMNNFEIEFFGQSAHGAGDPWNGRSALDAVELLNHAVNMMREHVKPSTRIHYVINDGGGAPNVVPSYAKVWYYVRDLTREGVEHTYARVLKAAEGVAMATETRHQVTLITGVHAYLLNRPVAELLDRNLRAAGAPQWTDEEQIFAKAIQAATSKKERGMFVGIKDMPAQEQPAPGGSTDVAEVSRHVPTAQLKVASSPEDTPWHAWPVVACGGMSIGHKAMLTAARTLGAAAIEAMVVPEIIEKAHKEFSDKMAGIAYRSPLPVGQDTPPSGN